MPADIPGRYVTGVPGASMTYTQGRQFAFRTMPSGYALGLAMSIFGPGYFYNRRDPWITPQNGVPPLPRGPRQIGYDPLSHWLFQLPSLALATEVQGIANTAYQQRIPAGTPLRTLTIKPLIPPVGLKGKRRKEFAREVGFNLPIQIDVPSVGVNSPVLRGSREDPEGAIRPVFRRRF